MVTMTPRMTSLYFNPQKKLGEEKRSALDDDALLMNIIRQIKRLTEEKSVSLFIVGEILTITNEVDDYNN